MSDFQGGLHCALNEDVQVYTRAGTEEHSSCAVAITKDGCVAINVGGFCYVKSVDKWFELAGGKWPVVPQ